MGNELPTFSSLDRAKMCPGSCALPKTASKSAYAEKGDVIHAFLLSKRRGDENLPEVPAEYRDLCALMDIDAIPNGQYEVSFGYDASSGLSRRLGENLKRKYPDDIRPEEMIGSADIFDVVTVDGQRAVYIGDLKTGLGAHVPPVRECLQVGIAAVAAARIEGCKVAVVEILRAKDNGRIDKESVVLDEWALDAIELEINNVWRAVRREQAIAAAGGRVNVTTGPHCKFCPAYVNCYAQKELALILATQPKALEKEIMEALQPATAVAAYQKYKAAQELLNRVRNAIYGYAEQVGGLEVGNGQVLGPVSMVRSKLDAGKLHSLMERQYGREAADEAVEWKATKTGLKKALRRHCKFGTILREEQRILSELKVEGGLAQSRKTEIRVHRKGADEEEREERADD